jgi:hypothetical protein
VGFITLNHVIYPLFCILPKFNKLQDITKYRISILLYAILKSPTIWLFILLLCTALSLRFLHSYQIPYFLGMSIALLTIIVELPNRNVNVELLFMESLKEVLVGLDEDETSKYSRFSVLQMKMVKWGYPVTKDIFYYEGMPWECAECNEKNKLIKDLVHLQGSGRRFIVLCDACHKPSIIQVHGLLNPRIRTEGRLPNYDSYKDAINKLIDIQSHP